MLLYFFIIMCWGLCIGEEDDLGYNLNIGYAINLFANYGDLSQVTQVVSGDYEYEDDEETSPIQPFREKNIRIFGNSTSSEHAGGQMDARMSILFCDTLEDLLDAYFMDFRIEGTKKPWKAFMGDWVTDEIMRTLGLEYREDPDNCCFVLAKLSKRHRSVQMNDLSGVTLKDYVVQAIHELNPNDESDIRSFMKNYGTHYIDSFVTGNFIYQVFKYKKNGYYALKNYMKKKNEDSQTDQDNLRFYFSSFFLKQVGDIRIASGNKTTESWAKRNLIDRMYLYNRPNLLRLYYYPTLAEKLSEFLDNQALLALNLKTLKPIFEDSVGTKFSEIVENDLQLWEVNA